MNFTEKRWKSRKGKSENTSLLPQQSPSGPNFYNRDSPRVKTLHVKGRGYLLPLSPFKQALEVSDAFTGLSNTVKQIKRFPFNQKFETKPNCGETC